MVVLNNRDRTRKAMASGIFTLLTTTFLLTEMYSYCSNNSVTLKQKNLIFNEFKNSKFTHVLSASQPACRKT